MITQQDVLRIQHGRNWFRQFRRLSHVLFGRDMGACWARANHDPCLDTHDAALQPARRGSHARRGCTEFRLNERGIAAIRDDRRRDHRTKKEAGL